MLYYQIKFGCKRTSSLEDTTEIVIFRLYEPSLLPWHWIQWTNFSAYHLMIIHHHTKFGKKKKKWLSSSRDTRRTRSDTLGKYHQDKHLLTFWTFAVTLTLNAVNPIFQQDTLSYDAALSNQVWLQTDQQFRRYNRNSHILIVLALPVALTLNTEPIFLQDTLAYDAAYPNQVW